MTIDFIPKLKGFMIYNTETGETAGKGINNFKAKGGKVWANLGHLKNHLQLYIWRDYRTKEIVIQCADILRKCVVYDISTQQPVPDFDILAYLRDKIERTEAYYINQGYKVVER